MKAVIKQSIWFFLAIFEVIVAILCVIRGFRIGQKTQPAVKKIAVILGNGPSLKNDLPYIQDYAQKSGVDIWCVNFFACSEAYSTLKPTRYVMADPGFWLDNVTDHLREKRSDFLKHIKLATTWDITIYLPFAAKNTRFHNDLASDKIRICFYNQTPISVRWARIAHWFYSKRLAMPLCQNVLVPSIFLAIMSGYKNILIAGADHSWHKEIEVKGGTLMIRDVHFYENNEVKFVPFYKNKDEIFTMREIFQAWSNVHAQYEALSTFANRRNVNIFNISSSTCIDAFAVRSIASLSESGAI
nr:hypothetical protein [uncultured Pseudogulbenkiania sp.]